VDEVAKVVDELRTHGMPEMTISRFYQSAVEEALKDYRTEPKRFLEEYGKHARR
jgi:hypothetical protein